MPKTTTLLFAPAQQYVEAQIVELTPDLAEQRIHQDWWADDDLLDFFDPPPIDRYWNWNEMEIENEGRKLRDEKFALMTGDGAIQGAMMISVEPLPSHLSKSAEAPFSGIAFYSAAKSPGITARREALLYRRGN